MTFVTNYRDMFEARISAGARKNLPTTRASGKLVAEIISYWSYDMEGHAKKCVEDIANLRIKQLNNFTKSPHQAWIIINLRKKMSQLEKCLKSAHKLHKLFSNVCIWLVVGDLISYGL